jgi:hypothetical protein
VIGPLLAILDVNRFLEVSANQEAISEIVGVDRLA